MSPYFLLEEICKLLDSYRGRDKILKTLCYTTKLIGGLQKSNTNKFLIFSKHMSATRAVLRLLDDLPMLKCTLDYGLGYQEPDRLSAILGVTTNAIDQLSYPVDKICWLAEHKLLTGLDNNKWDTLSSVFWATSIYLSLIVNLRYFLKLEKWKDAIIKGQIEQTLSIENLLARQYYESITCIRLTLDLIHAVSTLPKGFLWSSRLNNWQVGLVASISSVLGIYQMYVPKS